MSYFNVLFNRNFNRLFSYDGLVWKNKLIDILLQFMMTYSFRFRPSAIMFNLGKMDRGISFRLQPHLILIDDVRRWVNKYLLNLALNSLR